MRNIISIFVIGLVLAAAPALAQQKSSAGDRAMARAVANQKMAADALNKHDAAAVAALYTPDGIFVDPTGTVAKGPAAIEAANANTIKAWGDFTFSTTVKEAHALGNGYWFTFESTVEMKRPSGPVTTHVHGLNVMVPAGKGFKIAATTVGINLPPPGAPPQR